MRRSAVITLLFVLALTVPNLAFAAPIKTYIAEFAVTPAEASGLKSTLQTLLSSRLASEGVTPVASAAEADVVVSGSYTQFGKVFSLDATAKDRAGRLLATVFEQGESQDDLIPAVGRISNRLRSGIVQQYQPPAAAPLVPVPAAPAAVPALPPSAAAQQTQPQGAAAQPALARGKTIWLSQRIPGAQAAIAPGASSALGRELFIADSHALRAYRQEKSLKLLDEVKFPAREKVIAIDCAPEQGVPTLVYVSIMDDDAPASKVFSFDGGKLKQVAGKLPYLFRAIALNGGKSRIYAQQVGTTEDYYGDLYEASLSGAALELKNPIKLPRYANVYNYNRVTGPDGISYATAFNSSGHLIIYSDAGEEIWRSEEKFGGSETFFVRETGSSARDPQEKLRWRFIDQRITVSKNGEILVPQNAGFFVVGNSRSYSKHSLASFTWNGSSLDEVWRSGVNQHYLADYYLDQQAGEIVALEVAQKEGAFSKGGSTVRVLRAQ